MMAMQEYSPPLADENVPAIHGGTAYVTNAGAPRPISLGWMWLESQPRAHLLAASGVTGIRWMLEHHFEATTGKSAWTMIRCGVR
jgi:hypothetical protein